MKTVSSFTPAIGAGIVAFALDKTPNLGRHCMTVAEAPVLRPAVRCVVLAASSSRQDALLSMASAFEILNCTLMLLCCFERRESAQISVPSCTRIGLPRIEAILA